MKVIIKLIKWWQTAAALELHQIPLHGPMVDMGIIPGHAFDFHFDYGLEYLCRLFDYADGQRKM